MLFIAGPFFDGGSQEKKKTVVTAGILERTQDIPHDSSIYGISTHIYHKQYEPNEGKYTIQ